jgi:hypothetical protein
VDLLHTAGGLEGVADHGGGGLEQNHEIVPQGPVLDVLVVQPDALVDRRVAAQSVDLGQARESDRHPVPGIVARDLGLELLDEERAFGARTNEGHVALQDVP